MSTQLWTTLDKPRCALWTTLDKTKHGPQRRPPIGGGGRTRAGLRAYEGRPNHADPRPPAYLSPSRLACYDRCPQLFLERYIEKQIQPPSVERQFGTAVHYGIEAHFRGEDHEMTFLTDWRETVKECRAAGLFVATTLTLRGLELIDMVRHLDLQGEPEKRVTLNVTGIPIPIIGYVDLWTGTHIFDWKTAGAAWGPARVAREVFQPAIYSQAIAEELHLNEHPKMTIVVLPRIAGELQRFDVTQSPRQVYDVLERVREIHQRIEGGEFGCKPKCQEHREQAA